MSYIKSNKEIIADNAIEYARANGYSDRKDKQLAIMLLALKYACAAINEKYTIPFDSEKHYFDYFIEKAKKELYGDKNGNKRKHCL